MDLDTHKNPTSIIANIEQGKTSVNNFFHQSFLKNGNGITEQAAAHRAERLAVLRACNKFLMSPVELQVYRQFDAFIGNYNKKS